MALVKALVDKESLAVTGRGPATGDRLADVLRIRPYLATPYFGARRQLVEQLKCWLQLV